MFTRSLGLAIVGMALWGLSLQAGGGGKDMDVPAKVLKEQIPTLPTKALKEQIPALPARVLMEQIPTLPAKVPKEQIPTPPAKDRALPPAK